MTLVKALGHVCLLGSEHGLSVTRQYVMVLCDGDCVLVY